MESPDLLFLLESFELRFSEYCSTIGLPFPRSALSAGASRLFFSPDDDEEVLGFLLAGRPKLNDQHIATKTQILYRYATGI